MRPALFPLLGLLACTTPTAAREASDPAKAEFFEKKIRPVLVEHCYACHSAKAEKVKGGLLLDSRAGLLKGGESGLVVMPGKPEASRLLTAVTYKDVELQMPP